LDVGELRAEGHAQADLAGAPATTTCDMTPKLPSAIAATRAGKSDKPMCSVRLKFESIGCAQGAGPDQSVVPEGRAGLETMRTVAG